ncbi:Quinate permease [Rhodotorula toruloides]|nr:Quinate permease [Rhodotorula toruloides]
MGFKIVEDRPTPPEVYNLRIYCTGVVIAFGAALFGYCASFIGTALKLPAFQRDFNLSNDSSANADIISVFQDGAFFGALGGYPLMENLGRKKTLVIAAVLFDIGCILQIAATHQLGLIYAGRVVVGVAVGFVTTCAPVYLAELSPPAIRGRLVGFYEIAYQLMALVAFWLSYGIRQHLDLSSSVTWRIPFAIQIIPGGLLLVGACFLRESPRYLLKRHRPEEATRNLCWLRKLEPSHTYIEEELSATVIQINREKAVAADFKGNAATRYCRGLWHEATTPGIRNRLVIGFLIMAAQNMSGINSINYYSPTLFSSIGITDVTLYTGIYGVIKAASSLVFFAFLVDTVGRRLPLILGGTCSGFFMLYIAVFLKVGDPNGQEVLSHSTKMGGQAATAFLFLFSVSYRRVSVDCSTGGHLGRRFRLAPQPASRGIDEEELTPLTPALTACPGTVSPGLSIYPTRIRGACAAWTAAAQWLFQFIIARETPDMIASMGAWGTFLLFSMFNFLSAVFAFFFIPETKGKSLEEMDDLFGVKRIDADGPKVASEQQFVEDNKAVAKSAEQEPQEVV